jgi:hypothetical protein
MKKILVLTLGGLAALWLFTGCLALDFSGGTSSKGVCPTTGQQLIDLQKAKDAGIITEAEYQAQKAKVLGH